MLIPQKAVLRDNRGRAYVFVAEGYAHNQEVSEENPAKAKSVRKFITLGDTYGENWLVTEGLKDGDSVILEGVQKVTEDGDINIIKASDANIPPDADYLAENAPNTKAADDAVNNAGDEVAAVQTNETHGGNA